MKILCPYAHRLPSKSAGSILAVRMAGAFAALGHEVTLAWPAEGEKRDAEFLQSFYGVAAPVSLHALPLKMFPPPRHVFHGRRVGQFADRSGFDLSYGQDVFSAAACAARGIPTVFDAHKFWPRYQLHWWAFKMFLRSPGCIGITASSRALRDRFVAAFPELERRAVVAWNASDSDGCVTPVPLPPASVSVGYIGQLFPGKGVEIVWEVAQRCPWAIFHIVGGEPADVQHWQAKLKAGGRSNVVFHGFRPPAELAAFRAAFDVLLIPYQRQVSTAGGTVQDGETIAPMKLIEAMGAGKALVSSRLTVACEIIRHGENGLLVDPEDVAGWQHALEELRDPALRHRLGNTAKADHLAYLTWESRARAALSLISGYAGNQEGLR